MNLEEYVTLWGNLEKKGNPGEHLIDRLAKAGVVYGWPLDSPEDKREMEISLCYGPKNGAFDALFYFEAIPGEPLLLCVVCVTRHRGERLVHYRRIILDDDQAEEVKTSPSVVVGTHRVLVKYYDICAVPYVRSDALCSEGVRVETAWVALQQCKPPVKVPGFKERFGLDTTAPTIFGRPGDNHRPHSYRLWCQAKISGKCSIGVVFGRVGDPQSLDVHSIMSKEGFVACSTGRQPWEIHSYLYSPSDSGYRLFEWEVLPLYKEIGGVIVMCVHNTADVSVRVSVVMGLDQGHDDIEHYHNQFQVEPHQLRMFGGIDTRVNGAWIFNNNISKGLSV